MRKRSLVATAVLATATWAGALPGVGAAESTSSTGVISRFAGGPRQGPALEVGHQARGIAVEGTDLYITDELNAVLRKLDTTTGVQVPVTGQGALGYAGDDGPAVKAQIDIEPGGRAAVKDGVVYLADAGNQRIRRIGTDGVISTIAGTGQKGYSGDGGPATQATFHDPTGVAVDDAGNVYVADWRNSVVRKIDTSGIITTVAGTGIPGFLGDGGPAARARVNFPTAVSIDPDGNLLIADVYNDRIRRVGPDGIISTVAGGGSSDVVNEQLGAGDGGPATQATLDDPMDVQADAAGNLYIADFGHHRIRKVGTDGVITTVAGNGIQGFFGDGGSARRASIGGPTGAAPMADGSVYLVDFLNKRIRRVGPDGIITTVSGNGTTGLSGDGGPATNAQTNGTFQADVDADGNVYIADMGNDVIRKIDTDGIITTVAGNGRRGFSGDGGPATQASLNLPFGVAAAPDGSIYVADTFNHRIRRVTPDGTILTVAGTGVAGFGGDNGPAIAGTFAGVVGIDVDQFGNVYIADSGNNRIRYLSNGLLFTLVGNGLARSDGDGGQALSASIDRPVDVEVTGDGEDLYIVEQGGQRVRKVDIDRSTNFGIITTVAGKGPHIDGPDCFDPRLEPRPTPPLGDDGPAVDAQLNCPTGVAVDAFGNVYIADFYVSRLRRVGTDGVITTIAGTDTYGLAGDGGPAHRAQLYGLTDVVVDPAGDLLIADHGNNRTRKLTFRAASREAAHASWSPW